MKPLHPSMIQSLFHSCAALLLGFAACSASLGLAQTDDGQTDQAQSISRTNLTSFADCRFVPAPWADGDSFSVRLPDGSEPTVRLYGVD